jgi:hypothetical protein
MTWVPQKADPKGDPIGKDITNITSLNPYESEVG